jgi:hypothetical protein
MKLFALLLAAFALWVASAWHRMSQRRPDLPPPFANASAEAPLAVPHPDLLFSPCPLTPKNLPRPQRRTA